MKRQWLIILLLGTVLLAGIALAQAQTATPIPTTTPRISQVIRTDIFVRGGPGNTYLPVGRLQEGDLVFPVSRNAAADWVLIRYANGFGWIRRDLAFWVEDIDMLPLIGEADLTPTPVPGRQTATPFFPTETPTGNWVEVLGAGGAFVRAGPGRTYLRLDTLFTGDIIDAPVGRNADATWIMFRDGDGFGWIARNIVNWTDDLETLPVMAEDALTPSATFTPTYTPTRTSSATLTATPTPSVTASLTSTNTPSATPTATFTATSTATASATPTLTPSATLTATSTATASATLTLTPSATLTATSTATASATPTPSSTNTATTSPTVTPSSTPAVTASPIHTPEPTVTHTPTETASPLPTETSTATTMLTPSQTESPTSTFTHTVTLTAISTGTFTSVPPSATFIIPTVTSAAVIVPDATQQPTRTAQATTTPVPSATHTTQPTATLVSSPTQTSTLTPTGTSTFTPTPTTATITASATETATLTATATSTLTATPTVTPSVTNTVVTATITTAPPTVTATGTATAAAAVPLALTSTVLTPIQSAPDSGGRFPMEGLIGVLALLAILSYIGLYLRAMAAAERYTKGFVLEQCPVCYRGQLVVEGRQERVMGIPRARHIVRCTACRSVLRETGYRRWRYAVDPLENTVVYQRYNGQEIDEEVLVLLGQQPPLAERDLAALRPPVTPPSFVEDEENQE